VVIHGGKDDYMTDPAGSAGNRIACGVISQGSTTVGQTPAQ
jgi:Cu-Zn family superoxide dismutase